MSGALAQAREPSRPIRAEFAAGVCPRMLATGGLLVLLASLSIPFGLFNLAPVAGAAAVILLGTWMLVWRSITATETSTVRRSQ